MPWNRRRFFAALTAAAAGGIAASSAKRAEAKEAVVSVRVSATRYGVRPGSQRDQTRVLQRAIDAAAQRRAILELPAGRYRTRTLNLPDGCIIQGVPYATVLESAGAGPLFRADRIGTLSLSNLVCDARHQTIEDGSGIIAINRVSTAELDGLVMRRSTRCGIRIAESGGRISNCAISDIVDAAIFAYNTDGLTIDGCAISNCANNGIQVWTSEPRHDGAQITNNRIEGVRAEAGGTGQNGNGINIFRAGDVVLTGNQIADCAYSAIRCNSASNAQITANHVRRIGEVAIYAEFAFEGAVIANNVIDSAATGISVTNFNDGGRLAVVQGNLIRNLVRREDEPVDKRGVGISVEADTAVTGNTVENAASVGLSIGWHRFMRDVVATGNVVRAATIGIGVSGDRAAGNALVASNLISGATQGGVRTMNGNTPFGPELTQTTPGDRISVHDNRVV
ncbi:MAG: TIGR03808 family TAT-translocated repetitive protein [Pseudomonadota bacterium]